MKKSVTRFALAQLNLTVGDLEGNADRVIEALEQALKVRLFRPHRDVRFSDDKTPFYTHLHAAWTLPGGRGWYFGLSPDYATAGAGVMAFDGDQTLAWRQSVAGVAG